MDSSLTPVLLAIIGVVSAVVAAYKVSKDNDAKKIEIAKNAENARIKIEHDAATVKLELETQAAKIKLELETAAALALAETAKQREAERAKDELELAEFRAQMAKDLAEKEKELEIYRAQRAERETQTAQAMAAAASVQAEVIKGLSDLGIGQKKMTKAVGGTEARIITATQQSEKNIIEAVEGGDSRIVELMERQLQIFVDAFGEPPVLDAIEVAMRKVASKLKATGQPNDGAAMDKAADKMGDEEVA